MRSIISKCSMKKHVWILYFVGVLIELVTNGITGSLGTGTKRCVTILGNLWMYCQPVTDLRGMVRNIRLLVSLDACEPAPWIVSET